MFGTYYVAKSRNMEHQLNKCLKTNVPKKSGDPYNTVFENLEYNGINIFKKNHGLEILKMGSTSSPKNERDIWVFSAKGT